MKKVFVSIFAILVGATLCCGASLLLTGCNFKPEPAESGEISTPTDPETPEHPSAEDEGNSDDEKDDEASANEYVNWSFTVQTMYRDDASDIYYSGAGGYFTFYWRYRNNTACNFGTLLHKKDITTAAAWGKSVSGGGEEDTSCSNLAKFTLKWSGFEEPKQAYIEIYWNTAYPVKYACFGMTKDNTSNNVCRSQRTSNYINGNGVYTYAPGGTLTITGTYYIIFRKEYIITYKLNGGTYNNSTSNQTQTTYAGIGYDLLGAPARAGYTFAGWRESNGNLWNSSNPWGYNNASSKDEWANGAKVFTAEWTPNQYSVDINILSPNGVQDYASGTMTTTYSSDGVTYSNINDQGRDIVPYNTTVTIKNISPATGMSLASVTCSNGQLTSSGGVYTYKATMTGVPSGWDDVIVIQMRWASYTVNFNSNGGSSVSNKTVTYNSIYGKLPTPEKSNYTFAGWFKDESLTNRVWSNTTVTTAGAHTLYAKWLPKKYVVSFDANGGTNESGKIRYIRDMLIGGNTANAVNHWTELKAIGLDGVNYAAKTKGATSQNNEGVNTTDFLLNEVLNNTDWLSPGMSGSSMMMYQTVDLGQLRSIDRIVVWHYGYDGGRSYNNNMTFVSSDGTTWRPIFSTQTSGKYVEDAENGHSVNVSGNENLFNAWEFKMFFENSYSNLNNATKFVDITNDHEYPTIAFEAAVGYDWNLNNGKGGYVKYDPNLPHGDYQMTYTAWSPSASSSTPTTGINAVNTNGDYIYNETVTTKSPTIYTATFTVDENFGGFVLTWSYGYYTYFKDITLKSVDSTKKFVEYGSDYGELPTPTRGSYEFQGWTLNEKVVNATTSVELSGNHILKAKWKPIYATLNIQIKTSKDGKTYTNSAEGGNVKVEYRYSNNNVVTSKTEIISTSSQAVLSDVLINYEVIYSGTSDDGSSRTANDGYMFMGLSTTSQNPIVSQSYDKKMTYNVDLYFSVVSTNILKYEKNVEQITNVSVTNPVVYSLKSVVEEKISTRSTDFYLDEKGLYCGTDGSSMEIRVGELPYNPMIAHFQIYFVSANSTSVATIGSRTFNTSYTIPLGLVYQPYNEGDRVSISYKGPGTLRVKILFPNFTVLRGAPDPPEPPPIEIQTKNYGFAQNSQGYYENQNKGQANSYSLCRVSFTVQKQTKFVFSVSQSSEIANDFGIFGNLDQSLSRSMDIDSSYYKSFQNAFSSDVVYDVSPGSHFIEIKYRKNSNNDGGSDSFSFKYQIPKEKVGYFYFEDGEYPQTYVGDSLNGTLNQATTTELTKAYDLTYFDGSENVNIPVYTYKGQRYANAKNSSVSKWFKVEPIRWRVSEYGVSSTDYPSGWENYGAYNTNFTVVSDKVLGFGAVTNQDTKEGWSVTESELYENILDYSNAIKDTTSLKFESTTDIAFDKFGAVGQQNKVESETKSYLGIRVASVADVKINLTDKRAKASDLVMFMLGLSSEWADYWTRDLGNNLDNGIVVAKSGIEKSTWLNQMKGVRFAMTMKDGTRI